MLLGEESNHGSESELLNESNHLRIYYYKTGKFKGNAFIAGLRVYSAWHVVSDQDWNTPTRQSPPTFYRQDRHKDMGVSLKLETNVGFGIARTYDDEETVIVRGYDAKGNSFSMRGTLKSLGPGYWDQMQINILDKNITADPGMSGSPVFNVKNEVIGILIATRKDDEGLMEPLSEVKYIGDKG